jgi:hypothetical protein
VPEAWENGRVPPSSPGPSSTVAARYGTRKRPRWLWPAIAAVGIAIGIAWAAWVAFQPRPVTAKLYGYEVVDAHHVKVTLDIRRPDPVRVRCTVYAQSADHDIVGERTVEVPGGTREKTRFPVTVETERKAVTGVLRMCESLD